MFGIGLPELILIMAVALIVVGPDKLPELAKTLARQMVELKKAANTLKDSLNDDEDNEKPWEKTTPEQPQIADLTPVRPLDIIPESEGDANSEPEEGSAADQTEEETPPVDTDNEPTPPANTSSVDSKE